MTKEAWVNIFVHQLKGIMFHADAYGVSVLHGYKRLKTAHCKQLKEETENFMYTRQKSIERLGEIVDIPTVQRIAVPPNATEKEIADMWMKWETEAAEVYAKAVLEEPTCKMWVCLHSGATDEMHRISKMHF